MTSKVKQHMCKLLSLILSFTLVVNFFSVSSVSSVQVTEENNSGIYGDINNDHIINVIDILTLTENLITKSSSISINTGDLDGNGTISVTDLIELKKFVLGITNIFPAQQKELTNELNTFNSNQSIENQLNLNSLIQTKQLKTPIQIYNYIYNNIDTEFYWGSKKGAKGTFDQYAGNDIDQASLLIAMLNYYGYKASYITGMIDITTQQAKDTTGIEDIDTIVQLLSSQDPTLTTTSSEDGQITYFHMQHTWVQAEINGRTIQLDASFKTYKNNDNAVYENMSKLNIPETDLEEAISEDDVYNFNALIRQTEQELTKYNKTPIELKSKIIVQQQYDDFPSTASYTYSGTSTYNKIDSAKSNNITIAINDDSIKYKSVDLYGKNIIVKCVEEDMFDNTLNDIFAINNANNFYQVYITPILEIDGQRVLSSSDSYRSLNYKPTLTIKTNGETNTKELLLCSMYQINFDMGTISSTELLSAYNNVLNCAKTVNTNNIYSSQYLGNLLRLASTTYFAQLDIINSMLASKLNIYNKHSISVCVTSYELDIVNETAWGITTTTLEDNAFFNMDVLQLSYACFGQDADNLKSFKLSSGMISSALEGTTWREVTGIEGVSTTKVLQQANDTNKDILMISSANADTELAKLNLDEQSYAIIQKAIEEGNIVTVPTSEISINSWNGTGFTIINPNSYNCTDSISDGSHGGRTTLGVTTGYCVDIASSIIDMAGSIKIMSGALVACTLGGPIVGCAVMALGVTCLCLSIVAYAESINLMCQYIDGNEEAGMQLVISGTINLAIGAVSLGVNIAMKHCATSAIKNKLMNEATEDVIDVTYWDDNFIYYPDGTMETIDKFGENAAQIVCDIVDNPGFENVVEENADKLIELGDKQGFNIISQNTGLIEMYPEISIQTMIEHGNVGATALAIYEKNFIDAYVNGDTITTSKMFTEANEITSFIDSNIYIGGSNNGYEYTGLILTIPENNLNPDYIRKVAKSLSTKLGQMIKNKEIVKTINKAKINESVVTVAINSKTGRTYYGISGYCSKSGNQNPTRKEDTSGIIENLINNIDVNNRPVQRKKFSDNPIKDLKNCGEFNAINNALLDPIYPSNINDLYVYSVTIYDLKKLDPCGNCQLLYKNYIKEFIDID